MSNESLEYKKEELSCLFKSEDIKCFVFDNSVHLNVKIPYKTIYSPYKIGVDRITLDGNITIKNINVDFYTFVVSYPNRSNYNCKTAWTTIANVPISLRRLSCSKNVNNVISHKYKNINNFFVLEDMEPGYIELVKRAYETLKWWIMVFYIPLLIAIFSFPGRIQHF